MLCLTLSNFVGYTSYSLSTLLLAGTSIKKHWHCLDDRHWLRSPRSVGYPYPSLLGHNFLVLTPLANSWDLPAFLEALVILLPSSETENPYGSVLVKMAFCVMRARRNPSTFQALWPGPKLDGAFREVIGLPPVIILIFDGEFPWNKPTIWINLGLALLEETSKCLIVAIRHFWASQESQSLLENVGL